MRQHTAVKALVIVLAAVFLFAGYLYIQPMRPETAADRYSDYTKYLRFTFGDPDRILVYTENAGDFAKDGIYVTVQNDTELFWCGTVVLNGASGKELYREEFINLGPGEVEVRHLTLQEEAASYKVRASKFYRFTLRRPGTAIYESADRDVSGEYAWTNVLFEEGVLDAQILKDYGTEYFARKTLEGKTPYDLYCYDRGTVTYHEEAGILYPDRDSAVFVIVFDAGKRQGKIVDVRANMEVLEEFSL